MDYVQATDGSWWMAGNFPHFAARFRPTSGLDELLKLGMFLGAMYVIADAFNSLFPPYNSDPLSRRTREYVRQRDDETCYYCGVWSSDGHVDHMRSRKNHGCNSLWNLTWACPPCNLTKGSLNHDEFLGMYSFV